VADSFVQVPPDSTGKQIATNDVGGKQFQVVNLADAGGNALAPLTDAQLRATPVEVEIIGSIPVTIASAIEITNDAGAPIPISGTVNIDSVSTNQVSSGISGTDNALTTHSVITGETTAGGGGYVNVKVNPSGELAVAVGESELPTGAATDAALLALREACDTLLLVAQTLLRAHPRLDVTGRAIVNNSEVTQPVSGTLAAVTTVATVTNVAQFGGQPVPYVAYDRPLHIYDNIKVT